MVRAIIFDCFGVLTAEGWHDYYDQYFAGKPELAGEIAAMNTAVDAGELSYSYFVRKISGMAGTTEEELRRRLEHVAPNKQLLAYIAETLVGHYKLGILSNVPRDWLIDFFTAEQLAMFDAVALSFEMGVAKPHSKTYLTIAAKLSVDPSECVMVDDSALNCRGAEAVGMQSILYQDFGSFVAQLGAKTGRD